MKTTAACALKCICGPYFIRLLALQLLKTFISLLEEQYLHAVLRLLAKLLFSRSSGYYSTSNQVSAKNSNSVQLTDAQGSNAMVRNVEVEAIPLYPLEAQILTEKAEEKNQLYFSYHHKALSVTRGTTGARRRAKINQFLSS